jgi:tRNA threonylcarbamoyl adenosine modification protein YeaZ
VSKRVLLLINTATVSGVIGIARNGLVLSEVPLELAAASNRVVAAIDEALAEAGCQLEELSKIVLVKGPGTFTGSRVGASIAKAVSYALPCALTSVTTLEAVAWTGLQTTATATVDGPVWAVLDARRHQFYVQEFVHCRGTRDVRRCPADWRTCRMCFRAFRRTREPAPRPRRKGRLEIQRIPHLQRHSCCWGERVDGGSLHT